MPLLTSTLLPFPDQTNNLGETVCLRRKKGSVAGDPLGYRICVRDPDLGPHGSGITIAGPGFWPHSACWTRGLVSNYWALLILTAVFQPDSPRRSRNSERLTAFSREDCAICPGLLLLPLFCRVSALGFSWLLRVLLLCNPEYPG